jgi:hypothetical protein
MGAVIKQHPILGLLVPIFVYATIIFQLEIIPANLAQ